MVEERNTFRYTVGIIAIIGGLSGLIGLYFLEVPTGNRDAVVLALGIILGWGSTVINGEWGSSPAGREAAKQGVKAISGKPIQAEITNTEEHPIPTTNNDERMDNA